jgi:hypothetical protein
MDPDLFNSPDLLTDLRNERFFGDRVAQVVSDIERSTGCRVHSGQANVTYVPAIVRDYRLVLDRLIGYDGLDHTFIPKAAASQMYGLFHKHLPQFTVEFLNGSRLPTRLAGLVSDYPRATISYVFTARVLQNLCYFFFQEKPRDMYLIQLEPLIEASIAAFEKDPGLSFDVLATRLMSHVKYRPG